MPTRRVRLTTALAVIAVIAVLATVLPMLGTPAADAADEPARSGYALICCASSAEGSDLLGQWVADVDARGIRVLGVGQDSDVARDDFAAGSSELAVSELALGDGAGVRPHAELPLVAAGVGLAYHLEVGGRRVDNLRLSPATIVGIFTGAITTWADARITADNNGRVLPAIPVRPYVRGDTNGLTHQLTSWLDHVDPAAWAAYAGSPGPTEDYPEGTTGLRPSSSFAMTATIAAAEGLGAIGYVEPSAAVLGSREVPLADVRNAAGWFVPPTGYGVSIALRGATYAADGTADLTGAWDHRDRRAYPIAAVTSAIVPTAPDDPQVTTPERQAMVDFLHHSVCDGQRSARPIGYAPLPLPLVRRALATIGGVVRSDPDVHDGGYTLRTCWNPTFDGKDLVRDVLGEIAPVPLPCARSGQGPCVGGSTGRAPGPQVSVRLSAPRNRAGVHVVRPRRAYVLTVRTTAGGAPRYLEAVAPGRRPYGKGEPFRRVGELGGVVRRWRLAVHVRPGRGVWHLGVVVGGRKVLVAVRRA